KRKCLQHNMVTESGQFFKSSAETTFRYLCQKYDFEELHMAIDDVDIECEILIKALKKGKITEGLQYFPFQMLGKTTKFIQESKTKIPISEVETVIKKIEEKLETYEVKSTFATTLENEMYSLIRYLNERYAENHGYVIKGLSIRIGQIGRKIEKLRKEIKTLKTTKSIEKRDGEIRRLQEEREGLYDEIQSKELKRY
ncbi:MAG: hypothetical protein RR952_06665, partial [Cetobacterium sp.]